MIARQETPDGPEAIRACLLIIAVVLGAYGVVLSNTFGALDDYTFLLEANEGQRSILNLLIGAGRPVNAYLLNMAFGSVHSVANLTWLRAVTIIGLGALSIGLYSFCRRHALGDTASLAISCGIVLLPSFQVYAAWAQHFTTPYAGGMALLSAFLMTPACEATARSRVLRIAISTSLLLVAIVTYQPIAMIYCTGILISVLALMHGPRRWTAASSADAACVFVAAMVLGYAVFKLGQQLHPSGFSRYGLTIDVLGKIKWFISEPVQNAFSLYAVPAKHHLGVWVAITIVVGAAFAHLRPRSGSLLFTTAAALFCLIGSYAPNLVSAENWASYRSTGALGASVLVLFVMSFRQPYLYFKEAFGLLFINSRANPYLPVLPALALVALTAFTQSNVLNGLVLPNVAELDNVASVLADAEHQGSLAGNISIKPSSWADSAARPRIYDEFGIQSSFNEPYARAIVEIVLRETNSRAGAVVGYASPAGASQPPENRSTLLIDFPRLASSQKFRGFATTPLNAGPGAIFPLDITDDNWTKGIWSNKGHPGYSFVYRAGYGDPQLRTGDQLRFRRSGVRSVLRVDVSGDFVNVLVDGPPLSPEDGHPEPVARIATPR